MMYMFIVRHGETEWNRIGLVQGVADNPLNEEGIRQAKMMSEVFKGMYFETLITSPLNRTKETASYLCADAHVKQIREDKRLIEKDFGVCEGKTIEERYQKYPDGHAQGEESFQIVRRRMKEAIREYVQTYHENILIVTHGCAIAALLKELDPLYDRQFVRLTNTSVTIIDDKLQVQAFNMGLEEAKEWMHSHL